MHEPPEARRGWHLRAAGLVTAAALAGCAMPKQQGAAQKAQQSSPVSQQIAIDTPGVPRARCTLTSVTVGRETVTTPASVEVDRSPEIIVLLCRKPCYLDASAMLTPEGVRRPDGSIVYSYPAETAVTMRAADRCDAAPPKPGPAAP